MKNLNELAKACPAQTQLSQAESAALLQKAMQKADLTPVKKAPRRFLRRALMIAACMVLCTVTVLAATGSLTDLWANFLTPAQSVPSLDKMGTVPGITQMRDDLAITLQSAVCDGQSLYLLIHIKDTGKDNDTFFNSAAQYFANVSVRVGKKEATILGAYPARKWGMSAKETACVYAFKLPDTADNTAVLNVREIMLPGKTVREYSETGERYYKVDSTMNKGNSRFEFTFSREDVSKTFTPENTHLQYDFLALNTGEAIFGNRYSASKTNQFAENVDLTVKHAVLTPLSFTLEAAATPEIAAESYCMMPCMLTMQDGSTVDLGVAHALFSNGEMKLDLQFKTFIDPEKAVSITLYSPGMSASQTLSLQ